MERDALRADRRDLVPRDERLRDLCSAIGARVVDDDDEVDEAGDPGDRGGKKAFFVVSGNDHRDAGSVEHGRAVVRRRSEQGKDVALREGDG